jgi:ribose 5-phosphate isomerase B
MKIGVACDHGGYILKDLVKEVIADSGHEAVDLGTHGTDSVDYPDYAGKATRELKAGGCERIVLICGTGIGMSICANRVKGIRGTLCHDAFTARMSRQHNDSNCLILGARVTGPGVVQDIVEVWLNTPFEGGRHLSRLNKIDECADKLTH